jgi:hypothetical protein
MRSSNPVRHAFAFGLLVITTSLVAACGGHASADHTNHMQLAPSGFALQPDLSDAGCNGGRGVRLAMHLGDIPVVASGTMADGSTLTASSGYPTLRSVVLHSVTPGCAPNAAFGNEGVATVTLPLRPRPGNPPEDGVPRNGVWVNAIVARRGGGAILAGTYGNDWLVGEVTQRGRLDTAFGDGGWAVLPFPGEISQAVQEPSGRIVVAGDDGGGGCCTRNWAAALSARGRIDRRFGTNGRTELPTGGDSGVDSVLLEPDGHILFQVVYGNNGCWGVEFSMLRPSGRPVANFAARMQQFWKRQPFKLPGGASAFVGTAYVDGTGFTLFGTGQNQCYGYPLPRGQSPTGLVARFQVDGRSVSTARFASRMFASIQVFRAGTEIFVVTAPYGDQTQLTVTARRSDGSVDPRFGSRGTARIRGPWRGRDAALETMVSVNRAGPNTLVVVATRDGRKQMQLIRVHL